MSAVDTLNETELARYLETRIEGFKGPLSATKFKGGQSNPTFLLNAKSGQYVLRRQPPGKLLPSAHAVDREYRVLDALKDTDVPVARVYHLCEDRELIGSMFYVMEYCDGNIHWDAALENVDPDTRREMYLELNRVLAALHSVDINKVGLADYGKPGNYFARQVGRWSRQYKASEIHKIPAMDKLMPWLEENMPEDDGKVSLVHGDYRLDNVMFDQSNQKIIAVLDWELSTLGHPYADLAYQCMGLRLPAGMGSMSGLQGRDRKALNIPSEQEYVAMYCERMGLDEIPNWPFYLAFCFFRLAAIVQGVAKRAADGNASSKQAGQVGAFVEPLAQMALQVISE
ncbi:MAG: phosphotransferase family protein [Gammaproteobacteria bacterium]|nr:phosphotransferase family protein [Gammaproteobacteria bacterium]NNC96763.1 phosphotransferase family protein [Gammaproteobacteria bacterium]NNM13507.1 phosphotransferase family protein [Gammaproteobacteria bacterium]